MGDRDDMSAVIYLDAMPAVQFPNLEFVGIEEGNANREGGVIFEAIAVVAHDPGMRFSGKRDKAVNPWHWKSYVDTEFKRGEASAVRTGIGFVEIFIAKIQDLPSKDVDGAILVQLTQADAAVEAIIVIHVVVE